MDIKFIKKLHSQTVFPITIYKWSIENWEDKKSKILDLLSFDDDKTKMYTDLPKTFGKPKYFDDWYNILYDDLKDVFEEPISVFQGGSSPGLNLKYDDKSNWKLWTQRYYNGTSGIPYNNGVGFISCLLYLEFDYMEHIPTRFYGPYPDTFSGNIPIQYVDVREGEMLIFPSILLHDDPASNSDKPKTIQAFNVPLVFSDGSPVNPFSKINEKNIS